MRSFFLQVGIDKWKQVAIFVSFLLFGFLSLYVTLSYTSSVPWYDSWQIIEMKMENWPVWAIFRAQQNEHRVGLGLLMLDTIGPFFHWDLRIGAYLVWLTLAVSCVLALMVMERLRGSLVVWDLIIPFIFFSVYQWENLTWGYQITFTIFLPIFLAALYLFTVQPGMFRDGALLLLCFLGTVSSAQGLLVSFFIMGFFLFEAFTHGSRRILSLVLAGVSFMLAVTYFWGYDFSPLQDKDRVLLTIGDYIAFAAHLINATVGYQDVALWSGILPSLMLFSLGASTILLFFKAKIQGYVVFSLVLFSVLLTAALSYNRIPLGFDLAKNSRYATLFIPFYFGLYMLLYSMPLRLRNAAVGVTITLYVFVSVAHYGDVLRFAKDEYEAREEFRRCYTANGNMLDCPGNLSEQANIQRTLEFAKEKNISIFH